MFRVAPPLYLKKPEAIFRNKTLSMLLSRAKITDEMVRMLSGRKPLGFSVLRKPHLSE